MIPIKRVGLRPENGKKATKRVGQTVEKPVPNGHYERRYLRRKASFNLRPLNVFVAGGLGIILLITLTTFIIAFTPLREYIPGYASSKLKQEALEMAIKSDSLEKSVKINNAYIASIKKVLTGDLEYAKLNKDSIKALEVSDIDVSELSPTEKEQELRDKVIKEDKYNVFETSKPFLVHTNFPDKS